MPEKLGAHIRLYPDADDVSVVRDDVVQYALEYVNSKQSRRRPEDQCDLFVRRVGVNDFFSDNRVQKTCH